MEQTTILNAVLEVFNAVGQWISTAVNNMIPMFYDSTDGLTFLGILAVAGLGFSVIFLIYNIPLVRAQGDLCEN